MYRDFAAPEFARRTHSAQEWMDWLKAEGALVPTAPRPIHSCKNCGGAVGKAGEDYYSSCYQCGSYSHRTLDSFVPISYSTSAGIESMLHQFKDFDRSRWLKLPLACVLAAFLDGHRECLQEQVSKIDIATFVPSDNQQRTFTPLQLILDTAAKVSPVMDWFSWNPEVISRDFRETRPGRAEVKPAAFAVDAEAVDGKAVLLLDDTWTSGSSMVSSAAALKEGGARAVIGLTLGRQLNTENHYGSTDEILEDLDGRPWTENDCLLCTS